MPSVYSSPDEGAPAEAEGALCASGREYDANGHFVHGPRLAPNPLARLIAETVGPPGALTPDVARGQMAAQRRRARRQLAAQRRFLAALRGEPTGRNRRAA